jgi:hypothetical protein
MIALPTCVQCHVNVVITTPLCPPCEADLGRATFAKPARPECVMCGKRIPPHHKGSFVCSDQCQLNYDLSMADAIETDAGLLY